MVLPSSEHLGSCGDIFDCQNLGDITDIRWCETRDAANYPPIPKPAPYNQELSSPKCQCQWSWETLILIISPGVHQNGQRRWLTQVLGKQFFVHWADEHGNTHVEPWFRKRARMGRTGCPRPLTLSRPFSLFSSPSRSSAFKLSPTAWWLGNLPHLSNPQCLHLKKWKTLNIF